MNNENLSNSIEAILFYFGEPQRVKKLAEMLHVSEDVLEESLTTLSQQLEGRGVVLVRTGDEVMLATGKESAELIQSIQKEELNKELSKASLETLSVILYKDRVTRADIDYIRGVNSSFILRNLLIRGLISKETDPTDSRKYMYKPTLELLTFMGVTRVEELPNYESYKAILAQKSADAEIKE